MPKNIKSFPAPSVSSNLWLAVGSLLALGAGTYCYARYIESRNYKLEKQSFRWDRIAEGVGVGSKHELSLLAESTAVLPLAGERPPLRILHISDLHLSHPETHKIDFLRRVTDDDFDFVFLTGDVFEDYSGLPFIERILSRPPRLGAFSVLGNHDYYHYNMWHKTVGRLWRRYRHPPEYRDINPIVAALETAGFYVLRHEAVSIPAAKVHLVGIDYPSIASAQLLDLVKPAPENFLKIGLVHVPTNLTQLANVGIDLAFAGHTHGGQVRIPGYGPLFTSSELPPKEASGVVKRGNLTLHVSRGLGADPKTNFRLFCPPCATVIELHSPD